VGQSAERRKRPMPRPKNQVKTETKKETVDVVRRKRSWVPNPQEKFGEEGAEPGDNSRFLRQALVSWDLPPIDISDPAQVENRLKEYFTFCIENDKKPNMIGMANWLGVSRETVRTWKNGEYREDTHSALIKKSLGLLEELWVDYMQNGKINPASGIFLAKNMFGYRDVVDIAPAKPAPLGEAPDQKALEAKIADVVIDPEE